MIPDHGEAIPRIGRSELCRLAPGSGQSDCGTKLCVNKASDGPFEYLTVSINKLFAEGSLGLA